jgi:NADH-quinone oxidoreductase subunit L
MLDLLWVVPALPFAGFLALALIGPRLSRGLSALVGVGSVGISAALSILIAIEFMGSPGDAFTQTLWIWMQVGDLAPGISLRLDALSLIFVLVITVIGFLIHLYSAEYMAGDEGYSRFFAYMNLFVGMMLTLVLADNLLLLFLGWEGVGLCSYLLIGFWYREHVNVLAARKAFIVTRVGDTAFIIGLFLLFTNLGSLNIAELLELAPQQWAVGSTIAIVAAALLLGGAVGKSAQLPLQTWLPDAMAGPTPVSALIHAATMVTAGVYLIARTHTIFLLAPPIMELVAIVGAATLLIAGFSALVQSDIKRVLAYSTISQIGYMFLGLGIGAWGAAIFHFMTHAFFKALLFLGAGVIILAMHHEQNIFHMGGLRRRMPLVFWTFLIGAASLAAVPLITAGFYSKDLIIFESFASEQGGFLLWAAAYIGAWVTAIYTFRLVFITFFGNLQHEPVRGPDIRMIVALIVLAAGSIFAGFVQTPPTLGEVNVFNNFLGNVLPIEAAHLDLGTEVTLQLLSAAAALGGILLAYLAYMRYPGVVNALLIYPWATAAYRFWMAGWGFDWVYNGVIVRPLTWLATVNRNDFLDGFYLGIAWLNRGLNRFLSGTENGLLRWYAMGIAAGAVVIIAMGVFL